ncbi:MAG: hypothetical protein EOO75_07930 [Myxococcales bacterium]|nr:MAG: hypothetical protein EOO75_07930 [Myxococcales bacterium]
MKRSALDRLATLRQERVEEVSGAVARAQREAAEARARQHEEATRRDALAATQRAAAASERRRLDGGELRAADLAQGASWALGARSRQEHADQAVARAAEVATASAQAAEQVRVQLGDARAQERVAAEAARRQHARADVVQLARGEEDNDDRFAARAALARRSSR